MHPFHYLLMLFGVLVLVAMVFALYWERRYFNAIGKGGPWRTIRIAGSPIAFVIGAAGVAHALQPWAWMALRALGLG
jgi:hypothetical protein